MDRSVAGPMMLTYYKTVVGRSADEFEVNPANFAAYRLRGDQRAANQRTASFSY